MWCKIPIGLKDINQKNVCVGDKIAILDSKNDEIFRGEVKYDEKEFAFKIFSDIGIYGLRDSTRCLIFEKFAEK